MVERNSIEHDFHENMYPNLSTTPSNDEQFRLNKINETKDYFIAEIKKWELMSKNLSKYIASLDYFDKSLIVLFEQLLAFLLYHLQLLLEHQ